MHGFGVLWLALLPLAARGQTGPWLHVSFGFDTLGVPVGAAAWLAALAVSAAAWRLGRRGRWPASGLGVVLLALLAGAAWLTAGLQQAPLAWAQGVQTLALRASPAEMPLTAGQRQQIELRNEAGRTLTLRTLAIRGDDSGSYVIDSAASGACRSGLVLKAGQTCQVSVSYATHPAPAPLPPPSPAPLPGQRAISALEPPDAPRFMTQPDLTAHVGQPWRYAVQAVDAQGRPLAVQAVSLPAGSSLEGEAGQQQLRFTPASAGWQPVALQATDGAGRSARQSFWLGVSDDRRLPADPAERAAPLLPQTVTPFDESTRFLYTGSDPIQQGVASGVIRPMLAAVLRGQVKSRSGQPLPGVTVRVQGHPEYGHTRTRADGWFDLAVNGGGWLTLHYEKTGYASAQRKVRTPWRDWAVADDVVLVPIDGQYAVIDLTRPAVQAYWGNEVQDGRGKRRAAVIFPAGVRAEAEMPDGSTRELPQLTVRVSEYTVGDSGPQAMPAALPGTVGYTWAADFTADEARALGARHVRFDRPVYTYVSNFIGAPVGTAVPAGWYDFERMAWVGSDNGRVIEILSTQSGKAQVRVTVARRAATAAELAELGFTDDELQALARLYAPGEQLWRTPMRHFTPWDCNWPWGPPEGAVPPPAGDGSGGSGGSGGNPPGCTMLPCPDDSEQTEEDPPGEEEQDVECGCDIFIKQRAVGQGIDIPGSPLSLYYRSDRRQQEGPPLSPAVVKTRIKNQPPHPELRHARARLLLAGRLFEKSWNRNELLAAADVDALPWDGTDAYGRAVPYGRLQTVLTYGYEGVYYEMDQAFPRAFERVRQAAGGALVSFRANRQYEPPVIDISVEAPERLVKAPAGKSLEVAQAHVGGWTLRGLRLYDPDKGVLHESGGRQTLSASLPVGAQLLGAGANPHAHWLLLSDGRLLETKGHQILVRASVDDENPAVFAGQPQEGFAGDGGPARQARFSSPGGMAEAADGSVYVIDTGNKRLRRITPDGLIQTVAGNGQDTRLSSSVPVSALQVSVAWKELAALPDMSLLGVTQEGDLVRLAPSGMLSRLGGSQTHFEGVVATGAGHAWVIGNDRLFLYTSFGVLQPAAGGRRANPQVSTAAPDGSLLTLDGDAIWRIRPDGQASKFVNYRSLLKGGDLRALPGYIPSIGLIGVNQWPDRLVRLSAGQPWFTGQAIYTLGQSDGLHYDEFSIQGLPVAVRHALTGEKLTSFHYNANRYLTAIEDAFGNTARYERDAQGRLVRVTGAQGQMTALAYNAQGLLERVSLPGGVEHRMRYDARGLLTEYRNPLGHVERFTYDAQGKLASNLAADGFGWRLQAAGEGRVRATTALGRSKSIEQGTDSSGDQLKIETGFDGLQTRQQTDLSSGSSRTDLPDGMQLQHERKSHPVFGSFAPLHNSLVLNAADQNGWSMRSSQEQSMLWDGRRYSAWRQQVTSRGQTHTTEYQNDFAPQLTFSSSSGQWRQVRYTPHMQPARMSDSAGVHTYYEYTQRGQLSRVTASASGLPERATEYAWHAPGSAGAGQLAAVTNALGQQSRFDYDAAGRLVRHTLPDGRFVRYERDAAGRLTALLTPAGVRHSFEWDAASQPAAYQAPANPAHGGGQSATRWRYDKERKLQSITRPGGQQVNFNYDAAGRLAATKADAQTTRRHYNAKGQLQSLQQAQQSLSLAYAGSLPIGQSWSGALQASVQIQPDGQARARTITIEAGGIQRQIGLSRDETGRPWLWQELDPSDPHGQTPLAGRFSLLMGRSPKTGLPEILQLGHYSVQLQRNGFGEPDQVSYSGRADAADASEEAARQTLQAQLRLLGQALQGQIAQVGDCQLKGWRWLEQLYGGEVQQWHWVYDHAGLSESERAANTTRWGQPLHRQPDACLQAVREHIQALTDALQDARADYARLIASLNTLHTATGSGAAATAALLSEPPAAGLLRNAASYHTPPIRALHAQALQLMQQLQAGQHRWRFEAAFSYERDALGRITGQTQTGPTGQRQHHYEYDSAGRLTKHTQQEDQQPGQSTEWRYDANGNRTHENGQLIARYDSQDRLLQWKDNTYAYSEAGDLQEKTTPQGATRYAYDSLGNLRLVTLPDGAQIEYLIDPLNRRIGKKKNGQLQYGLIYQDSLRPIADTDENGKLRSIYLYADKGNVPTAMLRADKSYLIISDHLGSVRQVIDTQTGEIVQQLDYDAWGQVTEDSRPGFQPFGFAGGLHDPDTQLTRFGARDYDAETGRWTAKDPILFDGGDSNLYGYVLQNPVNGIDPSGLASEINLCRALNKLAQSKSPFIDNSWFKPWLIGSETQYIPAGGEGDANNEFTHSNGYNYDLQYVQVGYSVAKTPYYGGESMAYNLHIGWLLLDGFAHGIQGKTLSVDNIAGNSRGLQLGIYGAKNYSTFKNFVSGYCNVCYR